MKMLWAITLNINKNENGLVDNLNHNYSSFFQKHDYELILIPNTIIQINKFLDRFEIDGIILTGGIDLYQYCTSKDTRVISRLRDKIEFQLIDYAINKNIAILGICRGLQILNDYFGGRLQFLNMAGSRPHVIKSHSIICSDQYINSILKRNNFFVNSFHNYGVQMSYISSELQCFCYSPSDLIVEGFYHKEFPIIAIQWHPERFTKKHALSEIILSNLNKKNFWWLTK